jgi:hypothetical protein
MGSPVFRMDIPAESPTIFVRKEDGRPDPQAGGRRLAELRCIIQNHAVDADVAGVLVPGQVQSAVFVQAFVNIRVIYVPARPQRIRRAQVFSGPGAYNASTSTWVVLVTAPMSVLFRQDSFFAPNLPRYSALKRRKRDFIRHLKAPGASIYCTDTSAVKQPLGRFIQAIALPSRFHLNNADTARIILLFGPICKNKNRRLLRLFLSV